MSKDLPFCGREIKIGLLLANLYRRFDKGKYRFAKSKYKDLVKTPWRLLINSLSKESFIHNIIVLGLLIIVRVLIGKQMFSSNTKYLFLFLCFILKLKIKGHAQLAISVFRAVNMHP